MNHFSLIHKQITHTGFERQTTDSFKRFDFEEPCISDISVCFSDKYITVLNIVCRSTYFDHFYDSEDIVCVMQESQSCRFEKKDEDECVRMS